MARYVTFHMSFMSANFLQYPDRSAKRGHQDILNDYQVHKDVVAAESESIHMHCAVKSLLLFPETNLPQT